MNCGQRKSTVIEFAHGSVTPSKREISVTTRSQEAYLLQGSGLLCPASRAAKM